MTFVRVEAIVVTNTIVKESIQYMSQVTVCFFAEIWSLPSRNSVNVPEIFRRASAPALQTGHRNVPTAEHFPRNTVVSRDRFHPPGESDLATGD